MTKARPKEGPRAPLFYGALALACSGLAYGQTVELSDLEACARLETDELKLACFEDIVATGRHATDAVPIVEPDPIDEPPVAEAPVEDVTPAPAQPEAAPAAVSSVPSAIAAAEPSQTAQTPRAPAPEVPPEPASSAANTDDAFGRRHLEQEEPAEAQILRAVVADVTKDSRGSLVFQLDNGQVWRQIEPRYFPYPRGREFAVEISTGMMGEYRLQVEGAGRKVRIRRMK